MRYYKADQTLEQVANDATKLQAKWRLSGEEFCHLLATLLNEMRLKRALSHPMLLTPLERNQEQFFGRYNLPVGFLLVRSRGTGTPYRTVGFTSVSGGQTSLMNFVGKIVGKDKAVLALMDFIGFLFDEGFLVKRDIGNDVARTEAILVNHERVMLTIPTELYRCNRCNGVTAHNVRGVCARWRCEGSLGALPARRPGELLRGHLHAPPAFPDGGRGTLGAALGHPAHGDRAQFQDRRGGRARVHADDGNGRGYRRPPQRLHAQRAARPGQLCAAQRPRGPRGAHRADQRVRADRAHDTYFFDRPTDMIAGAVEPPAFTIDNERILRRQINSLVLEKLDFQFKQKLGEHFPEDEAEEFSLPGVEAEVQAKRENVIAAVLKAFNKDRQEPEKQAALAWLNRTEVSQIVDGYYSALVAAFQPWLTERDAVFGEILNITIEMARVGRRDPRAAAAIGQRIQHLYKLLDQIDGRYPLSYLSDQGFLPSYAFPSDTARLLAKDEVKRPVTRGMELALTSTRRGTRSTWTGGSTRSSGWTSTGRPVPDLDKTTSTVTGAITSPWSRWQPIARTAAKCSARSPITSCSRLRLSPSAPRRLARTRNTASGVLRRQDLPAAGSGGRRGAEHAGRVCSQYHRSGEILSVNTGLPKDEGKGFMLCRSCGYWQSPTSKADFSDHKLLHNRREVCGGNGEYFHLGHRFHTDVLLLRFEGVGGQPGEFFASLKAAMIEAANSVAQAEAGEIAGFTRLVTEAGQDAAGPDPV